MSAASEQADDARLLMPTDVARAIFSLGLDDVASMLFWHVLEQSWGLYTARPDEFAAPAPCSIDFRRLSALWGVPLDQLRGALHWLLAAGIFRVVNGGITVNKACDRWVDPDTFGPLLSPTELSYARETQTQRSN